MAEFWNCGVCGQLLAPTTHRCPKCPPSVFDPDDIEKRAAQAAHDNHKFLVMAGRYVGTGFGTVLAVVLSVAWLVDPEFDEHGLGALIPLLFSVLLSAWAWWADPDAKKPKDLQKNSEKLTPSNSVTPSNSGWYPAREFREAEIELKEAQEEARD